ncbi:carboxypeptidase Taq M32 metallopeptidase [Leptospira santarosai]|uniref:carboxypeptidase Taq M32 metallopeptidase n=1 Tax=Leptospira santarosai TaxID=28183 RepID=UPI0002BDC544|nr:carboxypeptidase Taq M32 metallopeptidase [Leptospira santarosai]EMO71118.1 carboxypeptidase Taq M32 metallopeptidase domain protein [Leptospira santarosai str. 200403458]MDI7217951.1 peptidase M32 [Leptospira santarosai]
MKEIFGITVPSDKEGVLQDVHWSGELSDIFRLIRWGNIYSAQLFQTFSKENSDFQLEVREKKDFSSLLNWLKKTFIGNYKANIT